MAKLTPGTVGWIDITTSDAVTLRDFYCAVVGWEHSSVPMKGYDDYCVHPSPQADPVAGICHAQGKNQGLPTGWLIYITVANLETSLAEVTSRGGKIIRPSVNAGGMGRYAVIQDPAGNHCALFESAEA